MTSWLGAFVVGLVIGVLGSGGSILNIPILIFVAGQPEKAAIAESLAIVGLVAFMAAIPYARKKLVAWRTVILFGAPGMLGAFFGAALAEFVPSAIQLTLLASVMFLVAAMMFRPSEWTGSGSTRAPWKIASDGLLVGTFTGLVGVGGGFLIVPTLVLLGGLSMHEAIGTSLVIIALNAPVAFFKHLAVLETLNLTIDYHVITLFTLFGIVGSVVGGSVAHQLPQNHLRRIFSVLLALLGVYMIYNYLPNVIRRVF